MGSLFSSMWSKLFKSNKNFSILILGLANAGKTTLLYQMYPSNNTGPSAKQYKQHQQSAATSNKLDTKM